MTLTNPNDEDGVMLWNYVHAQFDAAAAKVFKTWFRGKGAKPLKCWHWYERFGFLLAYLDRIKFWDLLPEAL